MFKKMTTKEKIMKAIRKYSLTAEQIAYKVNDMPSMIEFDVKELLDEGKIVMTGKHNGKPCYSVK